MRAVAGVVLATFVSFLMTGCSKDGGTERRDLAVSLGPDQSAETGDLVQLTATVENSRGPISYEWTFVSTPPESTAVLFDAQSSVASFAADVEGEFEVQLLASDETSHVATTIGITVLKKPDPPNRAPIAVPCGAATGPVNGQFANNASAALLDATGSTDADGDDLEYAWGFTAKPLGSTAILNDPTLAKPSLLIDKAGEYELVLQVSDGVAWSAPAFWTLVAARASQISIATGHGQSGRVGTTLPVPATVLVTNEFGNPIEGIAVLFDVVSGAGGDTFGSGIDHTEADGHARDFWTLGTVRGDRTAIATAITYIDNVGNADSCHRSCSTRTDGRALPSSSLSRFLRR